MTTDDLFPGPYYHISGRYQGGGAGTKACGRCGALVIEAMQERHHRWHGAVDSNATTELPGEHHA